MQTPVLGLMLLAILGLLFDPVRNALRRALAASPRLVFAVPVLLAVVFCGAAAGAGVLSVSLGLAVFAYLLAPVAVVFFSGAAKLPSPADFAAILLLWLPVEFNFGAPLVPRPQQGFLHSVAYAVAILTALVLFLGYRGFPGMKYNLPRVRRDYLLPLEAFLLTAPVLIAVGLAIGFIPWFHAPLRSSPAWMLGR